MTILSGDINLIKAQVQLDTPDGGGAMTSEVVVSGLSNNLFPDISELDRTYGRIALRKVFMAIQTLNTDSYFGSNLIVTRMPVDPNVSVCLFSTHDWFDRRDQARDKIERYLARAPKWAGHLLEMQLAGQRAIQIAEREQDLEPKVGQGLVLIQDEGKPSEIEQYVRVTKVTSMSRIFTVGGKDVVRKVLTIELSDPLRYNFEGITVDDFESGKEARAFCRDTRVANAANYYGAARLGQAAAINDASIQAEGIFAQLVPSAQSETPMVDLTAASLSSLYVEGNSSVINTVIKAGVGNNQRLFIGSSIYPNTLKMNIAGETLEDSGGKIKRGTTEVGVIEYDKGLITFNSNQPSYTGSIQLNFKPAATPSRVQDTSSISIVQDTRGYNYTNTLAPIPQPGSLIVSYMAQGKVYYLYDRGNGILSGSESSIGAGTVSYSTGSVIVTTGALPDAGSEIIFAWGKSASTFVRADMQVAPASIEFTLTNKQVAPNSAVIKWTVNGLAKQATDNGSGKIVGDATGTINYASGLIKLVPSVLYQQGTEFTIDYNWGDPKTHKFEMPARDATGRVVVTLPDMGGAIIPKSMELNWNVDILDGDKLGAIFDTQAFVPPPPMMKRDPIVQAFDDGAGKIKFSDGTLKANSSIDYNSRVLTLDPEYEVKIPKPAWGGVAMGKEELSKMYGGQVNVNRVRTAYRWQLTGWQMVPTLATMPVDEKGYIIVSWRTAGGSNSASEVIKAGALRFDLTPGFAEDILSGSVRFSLGGKTYIDRLGSLYHSIDPATGAGILAGAISYQSGVATITDWTPAAANSLSLESLVTEMNVVPVDEVVFRVPIAPVRSGSIQIRAVPIDGNNGAAVSVSADGTGKITSSWMSGYADYQSGVVRIKFGEKITVDAEARKQPWFSQEAVFDEGGVEKIIKPKPVYADSIRYNAVGYTYLPLSADILGLDPVRLPSDGRVPIFRLGDVVVVHNTEKTAFPGMPTIGTTLDVGRVRISSLAIVDKNGTELSPTMYDYDLDAGTVKLNSNYALGTLVLPLYAEHRIEDMAVVTDVQITGRLALNKPLTHNYPLTNTLVSSALVIGDVQGRVHNKFSQESWTNVWSDSIIGNQTTGQYNDILYPIVTKNKGSIEERWALIFTSSTQFRVVGQNSGQILVGSINADLAPINPATGTPYFTLSALGWGTGWAAGNVLRFNTAGANFPVWIARTVLQGKATAQNDSFQVQIRGDVDR